MASATKQSSTTFEVAATEQKTGISDLEKRKAEVLAQRNAILQQRMQAMAKRRAQRSNHNTSNNKQQKESMNNFLKEFSEEFDRIENAIKIINKHSEFKKLKMDAINLEQKLANSASFLPSYTFEQKNRQIDHLKKSITKQQKEIAPKPKFQFSSKVKAELQSPPKKSVINNNEKNDNDNNNNTEKDSKQKPNVSADIFSNKLSELQNNEILIENKSMETIVMKSGSINGSDLVLSNIKNCNIFLCDYIGALRMNNIESSKIITGPINTSLHVEYINDSNIYSIMRQCRIHYARNTNFYLHVNSEPVIEKSNQLLFAPYNFKYNELYQHWDVCQVNQNINKWNIVKDFDWFKQTQSPHWNIMPEENQIVVKYDNEDEDEDEL